MFNARSYSELDTYGRCPNLYKYRVIMGLQPKLRNVNLFQGTLAHGAWQAHYTAKQQGEAPHESVQAYFDAAYEDGNEILFSDELAEKQLLIEDVEDLIHRYLAKYDQDGDWTPLHVEEQFFATLNDGTIISFTPDLIVEDTNGSVWIVDHKTTAALPKDGVPYSDLQALLYYAGVKALYPNLEGFIFNYARKKRPVELRMNKTVGKDGIRHVNNVMKADTTYSFLRNFLGSHAPELLDHEMYKRRLAELRDNDRFFYREYLTFTDDEVAQVVEDVSARVQLIELSESEQLYPRTFQKQGMRGCESCGFRRLCQGEMLNWNTQLILDEDYEPRDPKNEYESEDE